jgi:hypothetical protein
MFKTIRITVLLFILCFVALNAWLSQSRSTDWNNSLWVKIYPINADGSDASARYIAGLKTAEFEQIASFISKESARYGRELNRPLRVEFGQLITEQPPTIDEDANVIGIILWSLKLRWWASSVTDEQDRIDPDVRIFVRYHQPEFGLLLENSIGLQKGMIGIVNAYATRRKSGSNNVIIAHEFLHTLGATDKYELATGQPTVPHGLAEPDRSPLYPQRFAEIMGGRIALARNDAVIPKGLKYALIGPLTALEIGLIE